MKREIVIWAMAGFFVAGFMGNLCRRDLPKSADSPPDDLDSHEPKSQVIFI